MEIEALLFILIISFVFLKIYSFVRFVKGNKLNKEYEIDCKKIPDKTPEIQHYTFSIPTIVTEEYEYDSNESDSSTDSESMESHETTLTEIGSSFQEASTNSTQTTPK